MGAFLGISMVYLMAFFIITEEKNFRRRRENLRILGVAGMIAMGVVFVASIVNPPPDNATFMQIGSAIMIISCGMRAFGILGTPGARETAR